MQDDVENILGDPGERARRKFSSTGERAPGYRVSPNHFQEFKRMPVPDWAQKMLCIIEPDRQTVSPELFFLSSYTMALVSITACLAHAPKKCTQLGNFQFGIKSPSDFKTEYCLPENYRRFSKLNASLSLQVFTLASVSFNQERVS